MISPGVSVAAKKGTTLAGMAACWGPGLQSEPFPLDWKAFSERPAAVKGAPLLGAAKRTLDGEDRSGMLSEERKAWRKTSETCGHQNGPIARRH